MGLNTKSTVLLSVWTEDIFPSNCFCVSFYAGLDATKHTSFILHIQ
jgi:hypothetical protein